MIIVIFGLAISSSWGNGHATLWRGIIRALVSMGHKVIFFERDVEYYASHRDFSPYDGLELILYKDWLEIASIASKQLNICDAAIITSYCQDARLACEELLNSNAGLRIFYDLDTPVTLASVLRGQWPQYVPLGGLHDFDIVLSYTGGASLEGLKTVLGAKEVRTLYGSVDPEFHKPLEPENGIVADLSYLGTYAQDRQDLFEEFIFGVAEILTKSKFIVGGANFPAHFQWRPNVTYSGHIPAPQHSRFYCSSRFTLNITRRDMVECGFCPSARLFEAAACGVPVISDRWPGIETFFEPQTQIQLVEKKSDIVELLQMSEVQRSKIAHSARERVFSEHRAVHRAQELEKIIETVSNNRKGCICGE